MIEDKDEEGILEAYQQQGREGVEMLMLSLKTEEEVEVYTTEVDESEMIALSSLSLPLICAALDFSDTAIGYFL